MTIVFQDNFGRGDFSAWTRHGNSAITTENPHSGQYCMRTLGGDNANQLNNGYADKQLGEYQTLTVECWVKIIEYPYAKDTNNFIFLLNWTGGPNVSYVAALGIYNLDGEYKWSLGYSDGGWMIKGSKNTDIQKNPQLNVWHKIKLSVTCGIGTAEYKVWINDQPIEDLHVINANSVTSTINYLEIGDSLFQEDYADVTVTDEETPTINPTLTVQSNTPISFSLRKMS
jgi:hypothetical protein